MFFEPKFFWTKHFLVPQKKCCMDIIYTHPKKILAQKNLLTNFLGQKFFLYKTYFQSKTFSGPKVFFRPKFFWATMFFLDLKCFIRSKMFFEQKFCLDQTFSCVPRTNVAWTFVSRKVLPKAYSNNCLIGNKHIKI